MLKYPRITTFALAAISARASAQDVLRGIGASSAKSAPLEAPVQPL